MSPPRRLLPIGLLPRGPFLSIIGVTKVEQVEAAAKAAEIALSADEISELEALGDTTNINTLREWEQAFLNLLYTIKSHTIKFF